MFVSYLPLFFLLNCSFLVSPAKRAWSGEALRDPICISLSCSWIRNFVKESSNGIHQLEVVSIPEWKVDMNTGNYGPSLLIIESTNWSSFLRIPHCLHCMTRDLNFEKKCCIVSKLLGRNAITSFSRMWPLISSCFPNKDSSLSHTYFGVLNPSRWKSNSLEMWMHMKPNASSRLFKYFYFPRCCWGLTSLPMVTLYKPLLHKTIYISALQST